MRNWSCLFASAGCRPTRVLLGFIASSVCLILGSCATEPSPPEVLGGQFDELRALAGNVITDDDRREAYVRQTRDLENEIENFGRYTGDFLAEYQSAFTDHSVGEARLTELTGEFRERQRSSQERFVDLHMAMASTLTEEEFARLARRERKLVEALRDAAAESLQ